MTALRASSAPSGATVILHWTIAAALIAMLAFGFIIGATPTGPEKSAMIWWHKSFGVVIGAAALGRIAYLARTGFPPPAAGVSLLKIRLSRLTQILMLVCSVAIPATGMLKSITYARTVDVFGLTVVPKLFAEKDVALNDLASLAHLGLGWTLTALIIAHSAAALHHHFVLKDNTLKRMLRA